MIDSHNLSSEIASVIPNFLEAMHMIDDVQLDILELCVALNRFILKGDHLTLGKKMGVNFSLCPALIMYELIANKKQIN